MVFSRVYNMQMVNKFLFILLFSVGSIAHANSQPPVKIVSAELAGKPIQQVAITTTDLPKAIRYFRDQLGLPFLFESNGMAFFDMAGIRLMVAFDPERVNARPSSILYFEVDDFDNAVQRLNDAMIKLDGSVETVQRTELGDLKIQQFRDLDGNALAIIGLVRRSPEIP